MGQYYRIVKLAPNTQDVSNENKAEEYLCSYDYKCGAKLMEFSWKNNNFVGALEHLINEENGEWAGSPIIVAGDYADDEPLNGEVDNIYGLASKYGEVLTDIPAEHYRYFINEDTKEFVDIENCKADKYGWVIHPLPLLLADGNGRGGGDYYGENLSRVGAWKRNVVVTSNNRPDENEYKEINLTFKEY